MFHFKAFLLVSIFLGKLLEQQTRAMLLNYLFVHVPPSCSKGERHRPTLWI